MNTVMVVIPFRGKMYAMGEVEVSNAPDEKARREENEMFAMFATERILDQTRDLIGGTRKQAFLHTLRYVVMNQYDGHRDEAAENATASRYFSHFGFSGLEG